MIGRALAVASVTAALLAVEAAPAATSAAPLLPHRAVYELTLDYTAAGTSISNAVGDLVFQVDDLCTAWSTVTEMRFAVLYDSGSEGRFGTYVSAWESKDGTTYEFQVRRLSTFGRNEIVEGKAVMPEEGGPGVAAFTKPVERSLVLPEGTLFPAGQSVAVLADAREGRLFRYDTLFDGTEEDSLFQVSSVIIGPVAPDQPSTFETPLLEGLDSWRIRLAYFEEKDPSSLPSHESTLRLYENGVVDDQIFDFGDFRLKARMIEFEGRADHGC